MTALSLLSLLKYLKNFQLSGMFSLIFFICRGRIVPGFGFKITIEFWFGRNHTCAILNFRDVFLL